MANDKINDVVKRLKDVKGRMLSLQQEENSLYYELLSEIDNVYMKMLAGQIVDGNENSNETT